MSLRDSSNAAVFRIRRALEPHGWSVDVEHSAGRVYLTVDHCLSTPYGLGFANDGSDHTDFISDFLLAPEFSFVERRPEEISHASLLKKIRQAGQANLWDSSVIVVLARVLRSEGLLTRVEADWLSTAGPAWGSLIPEFKEHLRNRRP